MATIGQRIEAAQAETPAARKARLGKLDQLLERSGIDLDEIAKINRVNAWQGFMAKEVPCDRCGGPGCAQCGNKGVLRVPEVVDMVGVQFVPNWAEGPEWPTIQPAPAVRLPKSQVATKRAGSWELAVILPDIQFGYFRLADEGLEAIHDEAALDVTLSLVRHVKPTVIVMVGDNLDLVEFGRYRHSPAFQRTTQATIDRASLFMAQLRVAAGSECRIVWLAGNHEERLPNFVLDNAKAAFGIKRPGEKWPVLSVPHLCRLDDYGVEYKPGWPAAHVWLNDRLRVIHGELVRSNGMTAQRYLEREKVSVIYGHIHRREWAEMTREDHDGRPATILAMSPGTLARIDGAVPSTKGGIDLDGRPLRRHENWQQGIAVVKYQPGDGRFRVEPVAIHEGWAMYGDKEFTHERPAAA